MCEAFLVTEDSLCQVQAVVPCWEVVNVAQQFGDVVFIYRLGLVWCQVVADQAAQFRIEVAGVGCQRTSTS